jgi:Flp pilus assembly protein TadD
MTRSLFPRCNLPRSIALLVVTAAALGGCQSSGSGSAGALGSGWFASRTAAQEPPVNPGDWRAEAATSGERYKANPRDPQAAIRHAQALRQIGQRSQAAAVLEQASIHNPNNRAVLGAYGRALADAGHLAQALEVLGGAHTPDQPDWRILSVQGAVLDQMGRHAEARSYYASALKIMPDEPSVMSNLGLSYTLSKDLTKAETTLRGAAKHAGGNRRIRQNLALVVGLQGRYKEAEEIARADLPPEEAAENIDYLQQMMAQHAATQSGPRAPKPNGRRPS